MRIDCLRISLCHLIGAIQGTWARFIGGLRHCCGNALAHDTSNFDTTGTGFTNHVSKDGPKGPLQAKKEAKQEAREAKRASRTSKRAGGIAITTQSDIV
jgi:hypothetical protein